MNLRDLKYFVTLAETGHFGRAAERCFVSQPTLSGQLKKMEDELGVVLFERTNRKVRITPVGTEILDHAKLIMEQTDVIQQTARALSDPLAGPIRLGAIPTLSPYLMPLILAPLKRDCPRLRLILSEDITDSLLDRLRAHRIDAALVASDVDDPDLREIPLFDEPFWLAHPVDHEFYSKETITRRDLAQLEMLLLADGHCLKSQVMDVCRIRDHAVADDEMADFRAASLETLLQLVGAGFGCTLVPALTLRGGWMTDSGIVARALDFKDAHRRVRMVFRKTFPRRAALDAIADVITGNLPNTVSTTPGSDS